METCRNGCLVAKTKCCPHILLLLSPAPSPLWNRYACPLSHPVCHPRMPCPHVKCKTPVGFTSGSELGSAWKYLHPRRAKSRTPREGWMKSCGSSRGLQGGLARAAGSRHDSWENFAPQRRELGVPDRGEMGKAGR